MMLSDPAGTYNAVKHPCKWQQQQQRGVACALNVAESAALAGTTIIHICCCILFPAGEGSGASAVTAKAA
jgi:hypothetical protein